MATEINLPFERTIWITSDHHFGHFNVIKYCERPFRDVHEMNQTMVDRWNAKVKPEDLVLYLGDFSLSIPSAKWASRQLNGEKIMIAGNHDHCFPRPLTGAKPHKVELYRQLGFNFFDPNEWEFSFIYDKKRILLTHFPPFKLENSGEYHVKYENYRPDARLYDRILHGHVHEKWSVRHEGDCLCINVGVDVREFSPVLLKDLLS